MKIALTVFIFGWLFRSGRIDFGRFATSFATDRWTWLFLGLTAAFGALSIPLFRWFLLLKSQEFVIAFKKVFRWMWIGYFFNMVVPGGVGLDMTRGYYLVTNKRGKRLSSLSTVLLDRAIGLHSMLLVGFVAVSVQIVGSNGITKIVAATWLALGVSLALLFVIAIAIISPNTGQFLERVIPVRFRTSYMDLRSVYYKNYKTFIPIYAISLISTVMSVLTFFFAGQTLGIGIPFWAASIAVPLLNLSSLISVTPGGLGIGEAATAILLDSFHLLGGGSVSLLTRMMTYFWALPGGLLFLSQRSPHKCINLEHYRP